MKEMNNKNIDLDNQDNKKHKALRKKIEKKRERKKEIKKMKKIKKKMRNEIESKVNNKNRFEKKEEKLKKYIYMFLKNFEEEKKNFINLFKVLDNGGEIELEEIENIQVKLLLKKIFKYFNLKPNQENCYIKPSEIRYNLYKKLKNIIKNNDDVNQSDNSLENGVKNNDNEENDNEFLIQKNDKKLVENIYKIDDNYINLMNNNSNNKKEEENNIVKKQNVITEENNIKKTKENLNKIKEENINKIENQNLYKIINDQNNLGDKLNEVKFQLNFI